MLGVWRISYDRQVNNRRRSVLPFRTAEIADAVFTGSAEGSRG